MSILGLILLILILFALFGGGWGYHSGSYNGVPALGLGGVLVIILLVLLFTGRL